MRDPNRLDNFYFQLKEIHKITFPDWRFGQLCGNFFGWLQFTQGRDLFFPEEDEMPEVHGSEPRPKLELSADLKNFENRLETFFGTKVALNPNAKDQTKGTIVINYYSMDDLTRIQEIMDNR